MVFISMNLQIKLLHKFFSLKNKKTIECLITKYVTSFKSIYYHINIIYMNIYLSCEILSKIK